MSHTKKIKNNQVKTQNVTENAVKILKNRTRYVRKSNV